MILQFGLGTGTQTVSVPNKNLLGVLGANETTPGLTGEEEVRRALSEPISSPKLKDIVKPGEKIAIISSDITRPMPTWKVMPTLHHRHRVPRDRLHGRSHHDRRCRRMPDESDSRRAPRR